MKQRIVKLTSRLSPASTGGVQVTCTDLDISVRGEKTEQLLGMTHTAMSDLDLYIVFHPSFEVILVPLEVALLKR